MSSYRTPGDQIEFQRYTVEETDESNIYITLQNLPITENEVQLELPIVSAQANKIWREGWQSPKFN